MSRYFRNPAVRWSVGVLSWIPVGIFVVRHVVGLTKVTGASMQPVFNPNLHKNPLQKDVLLLDRLSIRMGQLKRGDIVTLWSPQQPEKLMVKRVIALEGDTVYPLPPAPPRPVQVPAGHCWVEGDSTFRTIDSNTYGPVPLGLLDGRVVCIVLPFDRFGMVPNGVGKSAGRVLRQGEAYRIS
ncbi:putative peptidase [Cutaneotrichosporon oleaginosum]|uniref:Mitochondrial inner membrane protease subunit 2 n=1 Tax=Cutaneotrichosporon oleaginosum TaxID=879819 RepID=A0A0J1B6Y3_9TREE|nr:putative peptidase [Cutaneotrichosporon oleaginosum]KLT43479.1 putative peptidase [Cutaneotrichosporon oleaginosum]TXT05618.1 hypothetical protein COLE_06938 [Cutaneotrichosporon oleaginosum]